MKSSKLKMLLPEISEEKSEESLEESNIVLDSEETVEEFKIALPNLASEKLCEVIVSYRYLGIMQEQSVLAMKELAARRIGGEQFDFEARIQEIMKDLPKLNLELNKLMRDYKGFPL